MAGVKGLQRGRQIKRWAVLGVAGSLLGCAASFDDTLTPVALKSANSAVVFVKVTYGGRPCRFGNVAIATEPSPGKFVLHSAPMLGGVNAAGFNSRQLSLPAGTYHVGFVQCGVDDGRQTAVLGETDGSIKIGNPRLSFARFTISAGEVVNVGAFNLVPTDYLANSARVTVTDIDSDAMERLRAGVPKLSSSMVRRLMSETSPGQAYKLTWVQAIGG